MPPPPEPLRAQPRPSNSQSPGASLTPGLRQLFLRAPITGGGTRDAPYTGAPDGPPSGGNDRAASAHSGEHVYTGRLGGGDNDDTAGDEPARSAKVLAARQFAMPHSTARQQRLARASSLPNQPLRQPWPQSNEEFSYVKFPQISTAIRTVSRSLVRLETATTRRPSPRAPYFATIDENPPQALRHVPKCPPKQKHTDFGALLIEIKVHVSFSLMNMIHLAPRRRVPSGAHKRT